VAYSAEACRQAALAAGLQLGGNGYPFEDDFDPYFGCYTYSSSSYVGIAFYGNGDGDKVTTAGISNDKFRIPGHDCVYGTSWVPQCSACNTRDAWVGIKFPDVRAVRCATADGLGTLRLEASDDGSTWLPQARGATGSTTVSSVCTRDVTPFGMPMFLQNKDSGYCLHSNQFPITDGGEIVFWDDCTGEKNRYQFIDTGGKHW
jgi:hypothetical protein